MPVLATIPESVDQLFTALLPFGEVVISAYDGHPICVQVIAAGRTIAVCAPSLRAALRAAYDRCNA